MDLTPFKLDIDELLNGFVENGSTTLADMKKVWLSRKLSYIFEARPTTNLNFFMQSLYAHTLNHMVSTGFLLQRLGALYCLYCLYETQPFKPPFKIYLSRGQLRKLRDLVLYAKQAGIGVLPALVKRMLERSMFLFGAVDIDDDIVTERLNEITKLHNKGIQIAYEKLFAKSQIEKHLHMDLGAELDLPGLEKLSAEYAKGAELDLPGLEKLSAEYAKAKELAIKEASTFVGIEDIKHIAENGKLVGETMESISDKWNAQKEAFYQQLGANHPTEDDASELDKELENLLTD